MADPAAQQQPPQQAAPPPQNQQVQQQAQPQGQMNANQLQVLHQVQQLLQNAGINAAALGGPGGQPPAVPFAVTPGQVNVAQVIDYSSKGGKSLYTYAVTPLEIKFDLKPSGTVVFVQQLKERAREMGDQNRW